MRSDVLDRLLMTPQEYMFVGLEPPVVFSAETARNWYTPYGITTRVLDGAEKARELREKMGYVEIPRKSALILDIRSPVGHIVGMPFAPLDSSGITVRDPRVLQGVWDPEERGFRYAVDYTETWAFAYGKAAMHMRGEARQKRIEGKRPGRER
jgi:hypothetical protein